MNKEGRTPFCGSFVVLITSGLFASGLEQKTGHDYESETQTQNAWKVEH